jgi:hypothetical protein
MGVKITSLAQIPSDLTIPYFVYLLTSNYPTRVDRGLRRSFEIFAKQAGERDFVAFEGLVGEFGGEVMNAYSIDGIPVDDILPAILISTVNPHQFMIARSIDRSGPFKEQEKVILISLRQACESEDDVYNLVGQLIRDMKEGRDLSSFAVSKTKRTQFLDALVLEPNFAGVGVNLKQLWKFFRRR